MAHRAAGGAAMRRAALACIAAALTAPAGAHELLGVSWLALDPWSLGLLAAAAGLYLRRLCVLWRRAGVGQACRARRRWRSPPAGSRLRSRCCRRSPRGLMVHTGVLGALLTFADTPRFAAYASLAAQHGNDALADQQLGG
jgi:hypothetical protein